MYTAASTAFHEAVAAGNPQKALLIFDDAVFTGDDIDIDTGLEFDDTFNTKTDLCIGQATSNELRVSLFNDGRLLNDYEFGEFTATLGALIATERYTKIGNCDLVTANATWSGRKVSPWLKRNGTEIQMSTPFPVTTLLEYNGKVLAMAEDGRYAIYNESTGADITSSEPVLNNFMKSKGRAWSGMGIRYVPGTRMLYIWQNNIKETYEFVPLGVFEAERPNVPDRIKVDLTCYDRMTLFDKDMPSATTLGITYPVTLASLLTAMCTHVGVPIADSMYTNSTLTFINSTATVTTEPKEFATATMRDVIGWIAEAAGSNARFNRDGKLELAWIRSTSQSFGEGMYSDYQPYWYTTPTVNKLYNRTTSDGNDVTKSSGTGDVGYLIQDNPLMAGATAS